MKTKETTTTTPNIAELDVFTAQKMLGTKIEQLSVAIGKLEKDGKNTFSNYSYITNEQMITSLRTKCLDHKLSIIPSVEHYDERDFVTTDEKGRTKTTIRSVVTMTFKIIDLETGYSENHDFVGAEQDNGGKSMQQAITQCSKYFYFKLFNVTSHDEKDSDGNTTPIVKQEQPQETPTEQPKVEIKTLTAEQFKLAMESDAKGIQATIKYIDEKKISATSNQYNKLKIQLEKLINNQ